MFILEALLCLSPQLKAALIGVLGVGITIGANAVASFWSRRRERKTVVTALRSDVRSLVLAIHSAKLVESFIETHLSPDNDPKFPPWSDSPRQEDYFKLYEGLSPQIGKIRHQLAREIVRFYTYLRISRDAAAPIGPLRREKHVEGEHRLHAGNVLLALLQVFSAAAIILDRKSGQSGDDEGQKEARALTELIGNHLRVTGGLRRGIGSAFPSSTRVSVLHDGLGGSLNNLHEGELLSSNKDGFLVLKLASGQVMAIPLARIFAVTKGISLVV